MRTVMSTQTYEAEASPQEAVIVNREIPNFNNNMSSISEEATYSVTSASAKLPFDDDEDWLNTPTACYSK